MQPAWSIFKAQSQKKFQIKITFVTCLKTYSGLLPVDGDVTG